MQKFYCCETWCFTINKVYSHKGSKMNIFCKLKGEVEAGEKESPEACYTNTLTTLFIYLSTRFAVALSSYLQSHH